MYVFNTATNSLKKIFEGELFSRGSWGVNGWILVSLSDYNVYKFKANGDSITNLTQNRGFFLYPTWSPSASYMTATRFSSYIELWNPNGDSLKVLTNAAVTSAVSFFDEDHLVANGDKIGLYSISENRSDLFESPEDLSGKTGGIRIGEQEFAWANIEGIYKTNISTKQTTKIKASCNSQVYLWPTVNASRTKMLWNRVTWRAEGIRLYGRGEIVEMDLNAQNERVIPIPL